VKIVRLDGENVKLGIEAPADVQVHRQEVYDEIIRSNREALSKGRQPVPRIVSRKPASSAAPPPQPAPGPAPDGSTPAKPI
jgi:carbon storage regulator